MGPDQSFFKPSSKQPRSEFLLLIYPHSDRGGEEKKKRDTQTETFLEMLSHASTQTASIRQLTLDYWFFLFFMQKEMKSLSVSFPLLISEESVAFWCFVWTLLEVFSTGHSWLFLPLFCIYILVLNLSIQDFPKEIV